MASASDFLPTHVHWTKSAPFGPLVRDAIQSVLDKGNFVLGEQVAAFEEEFTRYLNASSGAGVASGTDALTLALLAGNVAPGDEVIVPDFAPGAVAVAVLACGATPVLAEVTGGLDLEFSQLETLLSPRTRAVVVVHLYGKTADMEKLLPWAKMHKLWVVEDCAHAHGAFHPGKAGSAPVHAGLLGDAGAFSFYPTKNLSGIGDGGFCISKHPELTAKWRELRQYGWQNRDRAVSRGRNSRLDEIQAAVLRVGLHFLEERNKRRKNLAQQYFNSLRSRVPAECILPDPEGAESRSVFHQYVVRTTQRDALKDFLSQNHIGSGIHYPLALHQQTAFFAYASERRFAEAEALASSVLSLPLYPEMRKEDCERVCSAILQFWNTQ
jgi:dTDP-4-amino-4,6-dideoxygalactose transaminase